MKNTFELSKDQCLACFNKTEVFEFVTFANNETINPCDNCAFRGSDEHFEQTEECLYAPCDALHRGDKKDGFWQKSKLIDYQHFIKMLKNGG